MQKAPRGASRKSTRARALERAAKPLLSELEAYRVQARDQIGKIYDAEPDEGYWPDITDREAELWGPLLINARLIGADVEARLLKVAYTFCGEKADIEADDPRVAKTIALLEAIEALPASQPKFTLAELVPAVEGSEAWAYTFADNKYKGDDGARLKASAIGYFLRSFRLKSSRTKDARLYSRELVISTLRAYTPEKVSSVSSGVTNESVTPQVSKNIDAVTRVTPFSGSSTDECADLPRGVTRNGNADDAANSECADGDVNDFSGSGGNMDSERQNHPPAEVSHDGSAGTPTENENREEKAPKKSWTQGVHCPGCRGIWRDIPSLSTHLRQCSLFDLGAMRLTELRLGKGQNVSQELVSRYQDYRKLGLGPLAVRGAGQA